MVRAAFFLPTSKRSRPFSPAQVLAVIGVLIGGIIVSLYLPMFSIYGQGGIYPIGIDGVDERVELVPGRLLVSEELLLHVRTCPSPRTTYL